MKSELPKGLQKLQKKQQDKTNTPNQTPSKSDSPIITEEDNKANSTKTPEEIQTPSVSENSEEQLIKAVEIAQKASKEAKRKEAEEYGIVEKQFDVFTSKLSDIIPLEGKRVNVALPNELKEPLDKIAEMSHNSVQGLLQNIFYEWLTQNEEKIQQLKKEHQKSKKTNPFNI